VETSKGFHRARRSWKDSTRSGHPLWARAMFSTPCRAISTAGALSCRMGFPPSPDHISFHKDGRCKKRGPPIVSGCYSNVPPELQENVVATFLVYSQDPDQGLRVWIPQVSGTGYAFGGKHCHKRYYHGKFLWGDWRAYHHHVSITFSCYHSWRKKGTNDPQQQKRGVKVSVDWNLTGGARLWSRRYLLGQVPKSALPP